MFETLPVGVFLCGQTIDPKKLGGDFVVAKLGKGLERDPKFHTYVQAAYEKGLPLIAYYEVDPANFNQQYMTLNPDMWMENPTENWVIKQVIGPSVMSGDAKRAIHGLIIASNTYKETATKVFPAGWMSGVPLFLARAVAKLYGLPCAISMDPEVAALYPHGDKDTLTVFFNNLVGWDDRTQSGIPGLITGIGTYHDSFKGTPAAASWGSLPRPPESAWQALSEKRRSSGLGNAPRINFWCFSTGDFMLDGIGGTAPLFLYMGSKEELYKTLSFTPPVVPPATPPQEPPKNPPATTELALLSEIVTLLGELNLKLDALRKPKITYGE